MPGNYDPESAEYYEAASDDFTMGQSIIGALMAASAFALVGRGLFFAYEAAVAVPAVPLEVATVTFQAGSVAVGGGPVFGTATMTLAAEAQITVPQMIALAQLQSGAIGLSTPSAAFVLQTWGFKLFSIEALAALAAYNKALPSGIFGNIGNWLGGNLHGGNQTPPGYPGFPATTVYDNFNGQYGCVEVDGVQECYWYH